MEARELLRPEVAPFLHDERERVAERQHRGCRRAGRESVRACFVDRSEFEHDVAVAAHRRIAALRHADDRHCGRLHVRQHDEQFLRLAGLREREQHVAFAEAAEVAVDGFGRVQEDRRRARGRERRRDLLRDDARLAHARRHDAAFPREHEVDDPRELGADAFRDLLDGEGFVRDDLAGALDPGVHGGARVSHPARRLSAVELRACCLTPAH